MIPVEIYYHKGTRCLRALKNFHQGEFIVDSSSPVCEALNQSSNPNASVRKGRIIAWACISAGDEITLNFEKG